MTIAEALASINIYPIPAGTIERICIDRDLTQTEDYTKTIGESQNYRLASADTFMWLHDSPNLAEQVTSLSHLAEVKANLLERANLIYGEYDDPAFNSRTYGFKGETFNG